MMLGMLLLRAEEIEVERIAVFRQTDGRLVEERCPLKGCAV
jgi:hypothetical protein